MFMDSNDFAGNTVTGYYFAMDRDNAIAALERFIQGIKDGRVLLQKVTVTSEIGVDDYAMNTLAITYAEKTEAEALKDLKIYNAGS
jgi:L-lactate utilization protein LutB